MKWFIRLSLALFVTAAIPSRAGNDCRWSCSYYANVYKRACMIAGNSPQYCKAQADLLEYNCIQGCPAH